MPMDPSSVWCQCTIWRHKNETVLNDIIKRCYTSQETHEVGFSSISGRQTNENEIKFVQIIF